MSWNHPHAEFSYDQDFLVNILLSNAYFSLYLHDISFSLFPLLAVFVPFWLVPFFLFNASGDSLEKNPLSQ